METTTLEPTINTATENDAEAIAPRVSDVTPEADARPEGEAANVEAPPAEEAPERQDAAEVETPAAPVLFDADAPQRIPYENPAWGGSVVCVAAPARDHFFRDYAKRCADLAVAAVGDDVLAARVAANIKAVEQLFDEQVTGLEGYEDDGEPLPADWRSIFSPQDKASVVVGGLFGVRVVESPPIKKGGKLSLKSILHNTTVRMVAFFDGREVEVSHSLKRADADTYGEFMSLNVGVYSVVRGGDEHMPALAALYDKHHAGHTGYAGRVPLSHKAIAFVAHMQRQGRVLTKN